MPRVVVLLPPVVGSVALVVTAFGGVTPRCNRLRPVPVIHARGATSAVIYFGADDPSPGTGALAALHPIALRARSKPTARIVVQAYANERHDLQSNLDLAQRRARSIVRQLQAWSVIDRQITYGAAESGPTDEKGARCEVELIESASAAETSTGLPEVSRAHFEFSIASPDHLSEGGGKYGEEGRLEGALPSMVGPRRPERERHAALDPPSRMLPAARRTE